MDGIKMSDTLKTKIVKASAQKKNKRKRLRPVYISAAAGLAACLAVVITLHHSSVIRDERVTTPEFDTAQASEIPYTSLLEVETAKPRSVPKSGEKTAVAKANPKERTDAQTDDAKTAKTTGVTQQRKTEPKTESAQTAVTDTKDTSVTETETNEQPEAAATESETDTQTETAAADTEEETTEIMVAKADEAEITETMPVDAAEPPATNARSSGTAAAASAPMPTEEATAEVVE